MKFSTRTVLVASLLFCPAFIDSPTANPVINEFMASNGSSFQDEDGDFEDWIEIYNPTTATVSLSGWYLTDDAADRKKWRFPAQSIDGGRFLIVFASGKDRAVAGAQLHTNFQLDSSGEYLALVMDDGITTVSEFDPYPPQRRDISYGLDQSTTALVSQGDVSSYHVPPDGTDESSWFTPGFDDSAWSTGPIGLGFQALPAAVAHWTFDADASDSAGANHGTLQNGASITGSAIVGAGALALDGTNDYVAIGDPPALQITGQITIAAWVNIGATNGIRNIVAKGHTSPPAGEIFLRVNNGNYQFGSWNGSNHMASAPGATTDMGIWVHIAGTYDGTNWNLYRNGVLVTSNADATGAVPVAEGWAIGARGTGTERFFSGSIDDVRIYDNALSANDVAALAGGSSVAGTDVSGVMHNVNASLWARIDFDVGNPNTFDVLVLRMRYEDGFVAYLNGAEVARGNAPVPVHWNSTALGDRPNAESQVFEEIDISQFLGLLTSGQNVLAVQGLNDTVSDADFLLLPELAASADGTELGYCLTPTPGTYNDRIYIGFVAEPKFSIPRGFYNSLLTLAISSETPGSTLAYTIDGTEPTMTNGFQVLPPDASSTHSTFLGILQTMPVRATAFKDNYIPATVVTHTYVFIEDIIRQDYQATLDAGFPTLWGTVTPDYGMDPDVINQTAPDLFGGVYAASIRNDLKAVPTLSVVMNIDDMFGLQGIYTNPTQRGVAWERPASLELIYPDGPPGFQVNAGIRIQGGAFRGFGLTKKNSLRVLFKGIYGPTKLVYPFFGPDAVDRFDTITFRMNANDGWQWSAAGDKPQYARDEFGRRTQLAMGQASSHGNFMHLYINGVYWGLYNPVERPDASFCAMYYGGEKENWDAINTNGVINGDINTWNTLLALGDDVKNGVTEAERTAAYMRIQGRNPDGTNNPAWEEYLDVDNYIDYMICNFYGGNSDWPHKNYYFARERGPDSTGFKFFMWDAEWSLDLRSNVTTDRTGVDRGVAQPYDKIRASAEFRLRFADHVHEHFFNGGALYVDPLNPAWDPAHPERNVPAARYVEILEEIRDALVGESARWGDQHREPPYTRNLEWQNEVNDLLTNYFPQRSANVLEDFRVAGLYPNLDAPTFTPQHGGEVPRGFELITTAPRGTIYYTLDGTDPRRIGGLPSSSSRVCTGPLTLYSSQFISARAMEGGNWSALSRAAYHVIGAPIDVTVSEVMYAPLAGDAYEYLELHNSSAGRPAVLDGYTFTNGIEFTFLAGTVIQPGGYLLVVKASRAGDYYGFRNQYGLAESVAIVGPYRGGLRNTGERVTLKTSAAGAVIVDFEYNDARGWPVAADGAGHSLVPVNTENQPTGWLDYGGNWRPSAFRNGSPGGPDPVAADVVLNEIVAHTRVDFGIYDSNDQIEILNTSNTTIPLADWYLSDDRDNLAKWHIGSAVSFIPPGARLLFDEMNHFNSPVPGSGFGISKAGERIYLSHLPAGKPALHRVADAVRFKGQELGVSLSRFPDGDEFWYATSPSAGLVNTAPIPDIVISEFMYNPSGKQDLEFIELHNPTAGPIVLENGVGPWRIDGGVDFYFPPGVTIPPGGFAVLVPFHPVNDATSMTAFQTAYGLGAGEPAPIYGPYFGKLENRGERIALERPQAPTRIGETVSWVIVDEVIYFYQAPWTDQADATGLALHRIADDRSGNDPANWEARLANPGAGVSIIPVTLSSGDVSAGSLTNIAPVGFTTIFSEPVDGFVAGDVSLTNGSVTSGSFAGGDGSAVFTFTVTPVADGPVTLQVPAAVAVTSAGGTPNVASNLFTFTYDATPPAATAPADEGDVSTRTYIRFHWTAPTDANGIASVLLHVGTAVGASDVTILDVTGLTSREVLVPDGATIYARLVVTDNAGNATTTNDSDGIAIDTSQSPTAARIPWQLLGQ